MNKPLYNIHFVMDDDIDFYKELADDSNAILPLEELCLISQKPIDENSITLIECNHTFNFHDLYKEVVKQKYKRYNTSHYDKIILNLKINEFICPYCRSKQQLLLPYLKDKSVQLIKGVNSPEIHCMPYHKCSYIVKSGKSKGNCCNKNAFSTNGIKLCSNHNKVKPNKVKYTNNELGCCTILKRGPNKGTSCGMKIKNVTSNTCIRHSKQDIIILPIKQELSEDLSEELSEDLSEELSQELEQPKSKELSEELDQPEELDIGTFLDWLMNKM